MECAALGFYNSCVCMVGKQEIGKINGSNCVGSGK